MPNHVHVLVLGRDGARARWDLSVQLRAWSRRHCAGRSTWEPVPPPQKIPDLHHLKRQIRYVHLNPCRSGLVRDPLSWEWSTHRDITGFVLNPWPERAVLERVFATRGPRLGQVMHRYISADPSTMAASGGTPPPLHAPASAASVVDVYCATAAARRAGFALTRGAQRELAVQVSHHLKMRPDPAGLGMCDRNWRRIVAQAAPPEALAAVLRNLAEPRCRPPQAVVASQRP